MGFDEDYQREVLEPARAAGDQPPEDLRLRYALPDRLDPDAVAAQVRLVRQCWRRSRGQLKYRRLIDRLEAEHRELAPVFAAAERGDLGPLNERLRGGRERARRRREQARARLADAAGAARMVTPAELESIARTSGVPREELAEQARRDRIEVREPDALPTAPPYPAYRKVRESLEVLGRRHLADFVFGGNLAGPMRVLGGFAAPASRGGTLRLDEAAVSAVVARWARRSRDSSTTHADTVAAALRSGADLDELLLYDLADRLRERLRQRASERALLRHAVEDLGVEPEDARRLVFAVVRESGPRGGLAGRLRALLDAGDVHAAAQLAESAAAAGGDEPDEEADLLAAEARQRLATAVRLREAAAEQDDPDRAWLLLADALRLVGDLPGAREHQRRLAPRPVPSLRADVEGAAVRLSWRPSPSTAGEVAYRVVRRRDRPPRDAADGDVLADPGAPGSSPADPAPRAVDEHPPVNVPLYYGVVAVRGEAAAAPAVAGPVIVRPEPSEVELLPGDGAVTGRWRCPAEAARVLVMRAGRLVPAGRDGFRERVPNGKTHHYRVCAVYLDAHGREVVTPGVRVSVTPSPPPAPVYEMSVAPDPHDPGTLLVRFAPPAHGTVELLLLDEPPPWPRSAVLPAEEARRAGRRLTAVPAPGGGFAVRPGVGGWLLAVTVAEDTAAIGAHHRHVHLPPPRRLVAERRGAHVHLGFEWPPDVPEVELTCRIGADGVAADGGGGRREIVTRAAYDAQGGVRVPVPEDEPAALSVASACTVGGTRVTGAAATVEVPARTVVRYQVERTGPPWRRALTVRLSASQPTRIGRLTMVLRPGRVMPYRPDDGEPIGAWTEVPVPGEVSVPAPSASGPYWVRCFADDDVIELSDPPVRQLHVHR
ncbi:hypothetical protein Arub01_25070 [Actinomadura rubrobrunea]|uniref:SaeA fourth Fn3-like domain-containing protein n=1 Tax=Actinomadura rubrobrunea TaxID=115335 RepID=A0A9W6UVS4_9ACTN|nr:hypothetical protein [Actinomadura rubrobrunea]GLW64263.1 hypothetical protein Arub01_25070 [Actinomadura rubrobrunea]